MRCDEFVGHNTATFSCQTCQVAKKYTKLPNTQHNMWLSPNVLHSPPQRIIPSFLITITITQWFLRHIKSLVKKDVNNLENVGSFVEINS